MILKIEDLHSSKFLALLENNINVVSGIKLLDHYYNVVISSSKDIVIATNNEKTIISFDRENQDNYVLELSKKAYSNITLSTLEH